LFFLDNRALRLAVICGSPRFDFDECQRASIPDDEVDFTRPNAVIARHHEATAGLEVAVGYILTHKTGVAGVAASPQGIRRAVKQSQHTSEWRRGGRNLRII
jgi:hypothetical protein